jgi:hypothetical protein
MLLQAYQGRLKQMKGLLLMRMLMHLCLMSLLMPEPRKQVQALATNQTSLTWTLWRIDDRKRRKRLQDRSKVVCCRCFNVMVGKECPPLSEQFEVAYLACVSQVCHGSGTLYR